MSDVSIAISPLEGAKSGNVFVVKIAGQLDETNVDQESQKIYALITEHNSNLSMLFDLKDLTYMNSKSIGYLTDWYTKVTSGGGKLVITQCQDNVLDVLSVVGITNLISHFPSIDEAKAALLG